MWESKAWFSHIVLFYSWRHSGPRRAPPYKRNAELTQSVLSAVLSVWLSLTLSRRRGYDLSTVGTAFFNHGPRPAYLRNVANLVQENKKRIASKRNAHIVEHFLIFCPTHCQYTHPYWHTGGSNSASIKTKAMKLSFKGYKKLGVHTHI